MRRLGRAFVSVLLAIIGLLAQHVMGDAGSLIAPTAAAGCLDAGFFSESAFVTAAPGDMVQFVVAFTNTGTCSWVQGTATQVDLGQGSPAGSGSPLACWLVSPLSAASYATTTTSVVSPGQLGWFVYSVRVPAAAPPGAYRFEGDVIAHATGAPLNPQGYYAQLTIAQGSTAVIGGRVTRRATGAPASAVSVQVHDTALTIPYVTTTDTCGYYTVRPTNGIYRLQYIPASASTLYQQWWTTSLTYDNATSVIVSTVNTQILDVALSDTFAITGIVRDSTGAAAANVSVVGWDATVACCWSFVYATTGSNGTFSLPVPAGSFKLMFQPPPGPLAQEFYVNADDLGSALPIAVSSASPTPAVTFMFRPTISGTITSASTVQAFAQVWLNCAAAAPINQRVVNLPVVSPGPGRAGAYAIPLPAVSGNPTVVVRFVQAIAGIPADQWYQNKTSCTQATSIVWAGTNVTTVDGQLP